MEHETIIKAAEFYCDADVTWHTTDDKTDLFSPNHVKYKGYVNLNGHFQAFTYQCNPKYIQPSKADILQSLLSDAEIVGSCRDIDDFANDYCDISDMTIKKILNLWNKVKETNQFFHEAGLDEEEIYNFAQMFDICRDELLEAAEAVHMKREFDHPTLLEGYHYIEDLKKDIYLTDVDQSVVDTMDLYGDLDDIINEGAESAVDVYTNDLLDWYAVPENRYWVQSVIDEGLCGNTQDIMKLIRKGQEESHKDEARDGIEDIIHVSLLNQLQDEGYAVISDELRDEIQEIVDDFDISEHNNLNSVWVKVENAIEGMEEIMNESNVIPAATIETVRKDLAALQRPETLKASSEASKVASEHLASQSIEPAIRETQSQAR